MNPIKETLKYYRVQTAGITMCAILIGALLTQKTFFVPIIAIIGLLIHISGFSMNNFIDAKFDKKYHLNPLSKKVFSEKVGLWLFVIPLVVGLVLTVSYVYVFDRVLLGENLTTGKSILTGLTLILVFGSFYNVYSKILKMAGMFIFGYCFALVLFGAWMAGGDLSPVVYGVAVYAGIQVLFQTSVEGALKDVGTGEHNIAQELGCTVGKRKKVTWGMWAYGVSLKLLGWYVLVGLLYWVVEAGVVIWILVGVLAGVYTCSGLLILRSEVWDRKRFLKYCSIHEMVTYWMVVVAIVPVIGMLWAGVLVVAPALWYVGWNYVLYGSKLVPDV